MSAAQPALPGSARSEQRIPAAARVLLAMLSRLAWGRLTVTGPGGFRGEFGTAALQKN